MCLSCRRKFLVDSQMHLDGIEAEPATSPLLEVRRFRDACETEHALIEGVGNRLTTRRHGELDVVDVLKPNPLAIVVQDDAPDDSRIHQIYGLFQGSLSTALAFDTVGARMEG